MISIAHIIAYLRLFWHSLNVMQPLDISSQVKPNTQNGETKQRSYTTMTQHRKKNRNPTDCISLGQDRTTQRA